jgi:hypothetical protein
MMRMFLICAAVVLSAAPAHAQLFMAWNACDGTAGSSTGNKDFDCTPGGGFSADLWGTFGLPAATPGILALDGIIDFAFQGAADVPPFWHFETGGYNEMGITYSANRGPSATCAISNSTALCGTTGSGCEAVIVGYVTGSQFPLGGPNRARLLFTNGRAGTLVTLPGMPTRVFAFHIVFTTANAPGSGGADCVGCETPTAIAWNQAILFNNLAQGGEGLAALIDSSTPGSTGTIPINGATIGVGTGKKSWGQIKSLYRR